MMAPTLLPALDNGVKVSKLPHLPVEQSVEVFGHVTLVEGYAVPGFMGCHAIVALRDTPGVKVAVLTTTAHLQSLLETALESGNLIAFLGQKLTDPPTPLGGVWAVDVYSIHGVILYSMK